MTGRARAKAIGVGVALAASVMVLAGCTPEPAEPPPPASPAQITSMMNDWVATQVADDATQVDEPLDDIHFIRFVGAADLSAVMTRCAAGLGARGLTYIDGFATAQLPVSAKDRALDQYADAVCTIQYPPAALKLRLRTPQQLDYTYLYYENSLVPCLRSSGVELDPLPSQDVFRERSSSGLAAWIPYDHLRLSSHRTAAWLAWLKMKCPSAPPGLPDVVGGSD